MCHLIGGVAGFFAFDEDDAAIYFGRDDDCRRLIQRLESRLNAARMDMRWPEQEQHPFPVEAAFTIAGQLFALEHTGIEPFKGHVQMEAEASRHFAPIVDALKNALGTAAVFELVIPANAFRGRKVPEVRRLQQTIIDWIKATAPTLPKRLYADYRGTSVGSVTVPGVPFAMSLHRFEPALVPGHYFQIKHLVENAEQSRTDRIRAAVEKKFPKLAAWNQQRQDNAAYLTAKLNGLPGVVTPATRPGAEHVFHQYTLRLADRDALTGLYNRRPLEEGLHREIVRAVRRSDPIGVMAIDIDRRTQGRGEVLFERDELLLGRHCLSVQDASPRLIHHLCDPRQEDRELRPTPIPGGGAGQRLEVGERAGGVADRRPRELQELPIALDAPAGALRGQRRDLTRAPFGAPHMPVIGREVGHVLHVLQ
jgi:hypothetical protein